MHKVHGYDPDACGDQACYCGRFPCPQAARAQPPLRVGDVVVCVREPAGDAADRIPLKGERYTVSLVDVGGAHVGFAELDEDDAGWRMDRFKRAALAPTPGPENGDRSPTSRKLSEVLADKKKHAGPFTWNFGCYLAGPMYSSGDLLTNARQGIDAAHALHTAAIPGVKLHCFVPQACNVVAQICTPRGHVEAQEWDDHFLRSSCKFVLRLRGASKGGDHEVALAGELGIPVFGDGVMSDTAAISALLRHVRETYGTPCDKPQPYGYAACTRQRGHAGPCATPLLPGFDSYSRHDLRAEAMAQPQRNPRELTIAYDARLREYHAQHSTGHGTCETIVRIGDQEFTEAEARRELQCIGPNLYQVPTFAQGTCEPATTVPLDAFAVGAPGYDACDCDDGCASCEPGRAPVKVAGPQTHKPVSPALYARARRHP